jgi:hypothetical protein
MKVGAAPDAKVGLSGQVRIGGPLTNVGQFRLDGRTATVFLQAVPLSRDLI